MKIPTIFFLLCGLTIIGICGFSCKGSEKAIESNEENVQTEIKKEELQPESFDIQLPNSEESITVQAAIPATWVRNPQFGAVVFQPENHEDYFYPPIIQYQISCAGSCDPNAIPGNIENRIKGIKDTLASPNINTGDPELDAIRANVEILAEEKFSEDGWIIAAAVTYPKHLSSALYIPKIVVHTFCHHPGDGFFVQTTARTDLEQKEELLPVFIKACKKTNY